mmetsp:Transcript_36170/g.78925  ORF Transcript_36170/g.78925 Transcript_36170/m.78925 type:complete len:485 (-) Transcript_36170:158-1612(-)
MLCGSRPLVRQKSRKAVVNLGHGNIWICCPMENDVPKPSDTFVEAAVIEATALYGTQQVVAEDLRKALLEGNRVPSDIPWSRQVTPMGWLKDDPARLKDLSLQQVVGEVPSEDHTWCRQISHKSWDGDGHFSVATCEKQGLPTLGQIVAFVRKMDLVPASNMVTFHISSEANRANGALLAGAVLVLSGGTSATDAWATILKACPTPASDPACAWDRFCSPFAPGTSASSLTLLDCLSGLEAARDHGWLDYQSLDLEAWQLLRRKFDASWLIPGEILGMGCPIATSRNPSFPDLLSIKDVPPPPYGTSSPLSGTSYLSQTTVASADDLLEYDFASLFRGVGCLVRLNTDSECSDMHAYRDLTTKVPGMVATTLAFPDGTTPSEETLGQFSKLCEELAGVHQAVAVHCKAGLGRTGAIVGAYMVDHYGISGKAAYGWLRLCRPGSIQTPAQERFVRAQGLARRKKGSESSGRSFKILHKPFMKAFI